MALFQEEQITQEQFDKKYNLNQPDIFSELGYDDIIKQRQETRQKRIDEEKTWVSNLISPDKINEWKNQGAMTAIEVFHKKNKNELVPYMGTWEEGTKSFDIKHISDKMQTGQVLTPEERQKFENFVLDLAEIQTRGYTFGGGAMNLGLETIPFMAEFGLGLITSGGTASVGATASRLSTEVLEKGLKSQIAEGIKKTAFNATLNPRTYAFTATRLPQQVRARMGDILLSDTVAISPEGQAILKESEEKPAIAFMKALALTNIETASEISGAMLVRPMLKAGGKLGQVIASPVLKHLPEGFADKFVALAEKVTNLPFAKAVDDLGFNGILEEMGEERVGDLLQFALNLDNKDGYTFEQLLDAIFPNITEGFGEFAKTLGQEALSFGVTGLSMNALDKGIKSIPKAGDKYTKDGFLIDAGIFRVAGYDSYLDSKVKEELQNRGKSEEEIDNAIHFSTRDDKVQFLKDTNTTFDTKKEYDEKEFEKDLKRVEVEEKAYEKLMQGGVSQDVAFANAKLFGQFFKKYGSGNTKAFDEWFDKFDVQYDVPVNGQKVMQFQSDRYEWNPNVRKVQITDKTNSEVQLNNSIWIPTEIIAMEGASYDKQKVGASFWIDFGRRNLKGYDVKDLGDFPETEQQKTEKPAYNAELDKVAIKHFGTTTNLKEAGYLLNNGKLLDFSGKKFGGQAGRRSIDHREINDAFLENENFEDYGFDEFIDNGAIRVMPESGSFLIARMPSEKQFDELKRIINSFNGEVHLELVNNMSDWGFSDITFSKDYEAFSKAEKILDDIRTFYNGGKISEFKTYFQNNNFVDWTDKFDKVPTFEEIEKHIKDIIASGQVFDTLSPEWKIDIKGGNRVVDKIANKGNFQKLQNPQKKRHNKYVQGIEELINNSEYSHSADNDKPKEKPNILKYHYFDVNVRIGDKTYWVRLECEENKKSSSGTYAERSQTPSEDKNNVNQNNNNVKVVHLYNIKEMKANKTYFQSAYSNSTINIIKENFDLSINELTDIVKADIENILKENSIDSEEFNIKGIRLYGSYSTGKNRKNSDLDFLVEYKGTMREDDAFNMFAEAKIKIADRYGKNVKIDINPTKAEKSGTIEEHLKNSEGFKKTYYQEGDELNSYEDSLIAGYTVDEVVAKYVELVDKVNDKKTAKKEKNDLKTKIKILEEAMKYAENPDKFSNDNKVSDLMLNTYYIMNDQSLPEEYADDTKYTKSYEDLVKQHQEKKEKKEAEYYGYYTEGQDKNIITIMSNANPSTALHELGHLFLNGLNELAKVDDNARKQLEEVNTWLGFNGEYTVQQQEKFARSFEAYLYMGKAPTYTLKQVFDNFKEWLKSVYDDITSLQRKGADISPEVQEMFDKMFGSDEYYQERKEINKLLRHVRNQVRKERVSIIPVRDDDKLDEVAKRHKEVSYQILSAGTGKSITYLKTIFETDSNKVSFAKKREAIEMLLDSVDDKITTSGGMRAEWREFYSDTGVSYNNDEVDGDFKLVEQALDTIINKSYGYQNIGLKLDERADYYEKAIDEADRQYKVLINEYRKGNRNVALGAIYQWLDSIDWDLVKDYEERFMYDISIIERNENIDKFDKAKRQILAKALEMNTSQMINENQKYQETVKEIMRSLNFLQPSDKARLTANILDVPNVNFLMSSIDNIMDIAKTMEDVNLRRNLEKEIHKELQGTKNVKKNGRSVGKYNYQTNKLFEQLRELDRLSPEKANELRLESSKFMTAEDNGLSFKDKLINKFLSYKSGGRTFADTELMKELYDDIVKIKLAGKSAKSEADLLEKIDESKDIEELIKIVNNKKDANFALKGYVNLVGNLESTINAIFNKDIKEKYGTEILYAETQAQAWQHEQKQKFEQKVAEIYGLPSWCWDKKILEYLGEKHTYTEFRRKYNEKGELTKARNVDRTLTKMDIIQAYIWSKNEVLEKRLLNQFGEETLDAMFNELSLQDVKFAETMMNLAQSFYPLVNKVFINKYGLDLPKVSCYFPSTPERGSEVDLYNDYSAKSMNNSFTKARAQSEIQAMDFHNPVATLYNHIDGVAKFVFMSESLDRANLRFKDLDLKRVVINKYGEDAYRTLEQALMNVTYKKEAPVFNGMNKIIDNMVGNWIQANIAVKPIVGLKQLLSANNYAVDMPYMKWQAGFLKALAHPKETIDYVMSIPYIKARYEGSFSNEFLKQTVENSAFALSKKLKDACNMFIKMGDIGAIIFGGKPYIDYLIKEKGMSEEQAIKQFIISTNRSQQSSAVASLSNFQVAMTRNPMGKLFIAFKNAPQQYIRMCGDAIVSTANGDMSKGQCAKMLFQFGYLQPFLYAIATSGSILKFLFTGDDDDLMKDASISIFNFGSDALPIIGDIYKFALNKLAYKEGYLPQNTPLLGDIQAEITKISKEDVTLADYLDAIAYLGLHVGLGYNTKAFANMGSGIGDIATGEGAQGAMKVLGYTEKRAKRIVGNEDKKKKKK